MPARDLLPERSKGGNSRALIALITPEGNIQFFCAKRDAYARVYFFPD